MSRYRLIKIWVPASKEKLPTDEWSAIYVDTIEEFEAKNLDEARDYIKDKYNFRDIYVRWIGLSEEERKELEARPRFYYEPLYIIAGRSFSGYLLMNTRRSYRYYGIYHPDDEGYWRDQYFKKRKEMMKRIEKLREEVEDA